MAGKRKNIEGVYSDADYKSATAVAPIDTGSEAIPEKSAEWEAQRAAEGAIGTDGFPTHGAPDYANGSPTPAAPAVPTPNGTQPVPQPARTPARKPRSPDSVRPFYQIAGQEKGSSALRTLLVRPTIGQARKALADAAQMGGDRFDGYVILRCKAVA